MKIDELRLQINEIDAKMLELFEARMKVAEQIGKYKKENNLPIVDEKREKELTVMLKKKLSDKRFSEAYEDFLVNVMKISKEWQKNV